MDGIQTAWGVDAPMDAADFPGSPALREQFRQCRCGAWTFLPLPCPVCGAEKLEPAFRYAARQAKRQRRKQRIEAIPYLALTCALAAMVWPPLIILPVGITLAVMLGNAVVMKDDMALCSQLFRLKEENGILLTMDALTDAYDSDLHRLESMLARDKSPDCAVRVFRMAQDMATLYHNRRVSALLMRCLLVLPISDGICLDVDQVCAWLYPEDLPDLHAALVKLYDCVRFTSLPVGTATAVFALRLCAARVQAKATAVLSPMMSVREACDLLAGRPRRFLGLFSQEEQTILATLWRTATLGVPLRADAQKAASRAGDYVPLSTDSGTVADYWFRQARYNPNSLQYKVMDALCQTNADPLGETMQQWWQKRGKPVRSAALRAKTHSLGDLLSFVCQFNGSAPDNATWDMLQTLAKTHEPPASDEELTQLAGVENPLKPYILCLLGAFLAADLPGACIENVLKRYRRQLPLPVYENVLKQVFFGEVPAEGKELWKHCEADFEADTCEHRREMWYLEMQQSFRKQTAAISDFVTQQVTAQFPGLRSEQYAEMERELYQSLLQSLLQSPPPFMNETWLRRELGDRTPQTHAEQVMQLLLEFFSQPFRNKMQWREYAERIGFRQEVWIQAEETAQKMMAVGTMPRASIGLAQFFQSLRQASKVERGISV